MDLWIFETIVDRFESGETDFNTLLNRFPDKRDELNSQIIDNIVDVLNSPNAGAALSVAGHADRDDTAGLSHIQHLAIESAASENRLSSAMDVINQLVQQAEPSAPADLNTLNYFDVHLRAPGAGVLVNDGGALTEDQRRANRRVQVRLLVYKP